MNLVERFERVSNELHEATKEVEDRIKILEAVIVECDRERRDFLHLLEFEEFNAAEGYYISKQLKDISKKRRVAKDELLMLQSIKTVANKSFKLDAHASGLCQTIKNKKREFKARVYTPRARHDLQPRFDRIYLRKGKEVEQCNLTETKQT